MAFYKVTFFQRYLEYGMTHSLYQIGGDNAHDAVEDRAHKLAEITCTLMGGKAEMPYIRVSNVDTERDATKITTGYYCLGTGEAKGPGGAVDIEPAIQTAPDVGWTAMMCELRANPRQRGRIFLRFIPDDVVNNLPGRPRKGAWNTAFKLWKAHLEAQANGWCIRTKAKNGNTTPRKVRQIVVKGLDPSKLVVDWFGDITTVINGKIRIFGVKSFPNVNGVYSIRNVLGTAGVEIDNTAGLVDPQKVGIEGKVEYLQYDYPQITAVEEPQIRERRGGRPFGSLPGRRKKV